MQLDISLQVCNGLMCSTQLLGGCLELLLLGLETVGEKEGLLDSSLGGSWCRSDGLNEGITDHVGAIALDGGVVCHAHDCLIEFFFNQLVVSKPLLGHSKLSLDVGTSLSMCGLKLVVFTLENINLLLE